MLMQTPFFRIIPEDWFRENICTPLSKDQVNYVCNVSCLSYKRSPLIGRFHLHRFRIEVVHLKRQSSGVWFLFQEVGLFPRDMPGTCAALRKFHTYI
jgi:hypothetical protein